MHNLLAIIAGIVAVLATLPYIRDTLKGKTHPNIVTWFTWTLINTITMVAALSGHAVQTAIFAGGFALCTGLVVLAGLKSGIKKYTLFDLICQTLALFGIVLWRITGDPSNAILFNIVADFIGVFPTYRHSWRLPGEETWESYALGSISSVIGIISVVSFNFISIAYPTYILLSDLSLVLVILYRRSAKLKQKSSRP